MSKHVLWVEDEAAIRESVELFLTREGYTVTSVATVEESLGVLGEAPDLDLVLTDLRLPDGSGLDLIRRALEADPALPTIIVTAHGSIPSAVEAVQAGAFYYLEKPFDLGDLATLADRATRCRELERRVDELSERVRDKLSFAGIVGRSPAMLAVLRKVERIAATEARVLITGPSGSGKGLIARTIHEHSGRRKGRFVKVNCGNVPDDLLQSELFGYVPGGFTGAVKQKPGKFMHASGGTLFLDEIGEMSPMLQAALLGAIEDGAVERLGALDPTPVDIRIVAATHRDLARRVKEGAFREDLYWRLHGVTIEVPPLAARRDDVPLLLEWSLTRHLDGSVKPGALFTQPALAKLTAYPWPGNVRELDNLVEHLVALHDGGPIDVCDLPDPYRHAPAKGETPRELIDELELPEEGFSLKDWLDSARERLVLNALERTDWRVGPAARMLGMNRTTLHEQMRRLGIRRSAANEADEGERGAG